MAAPFAEPLLLQAAAAWEAHAPAGCARPPPPAAALRRIPEGLPAEPAATGGGGARWRRRAGEAEAGVLRVERSVCACPLVVAAGGERLKGGAAGGSGGEAGVPAGPSVAVV